MGVCADPPGARTGETAETAPETVRVTVAAAGGRVGLVLPADLPVAELVPGLARVLGRLDGRTAYGGFRLSTSDGRRLRAESGLTDQGVRHGQVLTLVAVVDDPEPPTYDDPAEAMADAVGVPTAPGTAAEALVAGVVVGTTSTVGLLAAMLAGPGAALVVLLGLAAAVLVTVATALSRVRGRGLPAVLVAWLACAQAAGAGSLVGAADVRVRLALAAAGLVLTGAAAAAGLAGGRLLLLPPIVVGAVLLAAVTASSALPVRLAWVVTVLLATVTVTAERLPALALAASGGRAPTGGRHVDEPVDPDRVRAWARAADRLVVAGTASVVTLLVVAAPYAVSTGPAGLVVVVLCDLVVLLRARGRREPVRTVGGAGALLGLLATAVGALWLQPAWRGAEAATLSVVGVCGLAHLLGARPDPLHLDRLCQVTRSLALVALPSAVLVAGGVLPVPFR